MIIIYTDRFMKPEIWALNLFFITLIRPSKKGNKALVEHERVHMHQILKWWVLWPFMYHCTKKWRLKFEVEAYKASIEHGRSVDSAAKALCKYYGLDITKEEAKKLLTT